MDNAALILTDKEEFIDFSSSSEDNEYKFIKK